MSTLYQIIFCHPKQFCSPTTLCSFKSYKPWNKKDITTVGRGRKQIWPFSSWMLGNELWMQNEMPLGTTVRQVFKLPGWVVSRWNLVCTMCDTCTYMHSSQRKFQGVGLLANLFYHTLYTIYNARFAVILIQLAAMFLNVWCSIKLTISVLSNNIS